MALVYIWNTPLKVLFARFTLSSRSENTKGIDFSIDFGIDFGIAYLVSQYFASLS